MPPFPKASKRVAGSAPHPVVAFFRAPLSLAVTLREFILDAASRGRCCGAAAPPPLAPLPSAEFESRGERRNAKTVLSD